MFFYNVAPLLTQNLSLLSVMPQENNGDGAFQTFATLKVI